MARLPLSAIKITELLKLFSPPERLLARIRIKRIPHSAGDDMELNKNMANDQVANHAKRLERTAPHRPCEELGNAECDVLIPGRSSFNEQGIDRAYEVRIRSRKPTTQNMKKVVSPDGVRAYSVTCGPSNRCVASVANESDPRRR